MIATLAAYCSIFYLVCLNLAIISSLSRSEKWLFNKEFAKLLFYDFLVLSAQGN